MRIGFLTRNAATMAGVGFITSNVLQIGSAKECQNSIREAASYGFNIANILLMASGSQRLIAVTPPCYVSM